MRLPAALAALAVLLLATPAAADDTLPGPYPAEYVKAFDGDTVTVRAAIWPDITVTTSVRLRGVDTPEIRGECAEEKRLAREARDYVRRLMESAERIVVENVEHGMYAGRVVADVRLDGRDLADAVIAEGLGRVYDGGARKGWCGEKEFSDG